MTGIASHRQAWDAMMAHYLPGRADLIAAGCAETERVLGWPPRSVLDLGGGPGTTIEALLHRWPHTSATLSIPWKRGGLFKLPGPGGLR